MKTKGAIWDEYTIVEFKDDGKTPKTVQCKHPGCDYRKAANQNRMLQHWRDKHAQPEEVEDALPVDTPEDVEVDCDLSPLLHIWEGGRLWLAHGGPTKVANNSPSPHPPYKSGKSTIFGKITCF